MNFEAEGQEDLSLGRHAARFAFFNPIYREGRDARQPCEFGLAQHPGFSNRLNPVRLMH